MSDEIARETHDVHLRSRHPDYDPDVRCRANGCDQPARPSRSRDEWEAAMTDENGSARDTLVEAISWAERIDTGRWGYERAAAMLDGYVERIVAERLAAVDSAWQRSWAEARNTLDAVAERLDEHSFSELSCVLYDPPEPLVGRDD